MVKRAKRANGPKGSKSQTAKQRNKQTNKHHLVAEACVSLSKLLTRPKHHLVKVCSRLLFLCLMCLLFVCLFLCTVYSLYSQKCAGHKEIDKQPIQTKKKKTTRSKMTEKRDTCVQPTTHTNKQTKKLVMFIL